MFVTVSCLLLFDSDKFSIRERFVYYYINVIPKDRRVPSQEGRKISVKEKKRGKQEKKDEVIAPRRIGRMHIK